jgi:hypothetical protein
MKMTVLSMREFENWLDAYFSAWQAGDADAAVELFSDDAQYHETPFDGLMVGREAIHRYWHEGAGEAQKDVHYSYSALAIVENSGLARWQASFARVPSGRYVELDGFLMAEFSTAKHCSVFREWWHRRETEQGDEQP